MKAFQSVAALLFSAAIGAVLLIVLFSSGSRSHASGESEIDVLWRAVSKLESRVKQLEAGCGCECSRASSKPATSGPRRVWVPPRQTRDEDDYTPGRWEVVQ